MAHSVKHEHSKKLAVSLLLCQNVNEKETERFYSPYESATTLNLMTLSITTFSIRTLSIMTFSIITFSIMTLSIMTFSITMNET